MSQLKPLLAANADPSALRFPLLASPKLDGIRALVKDGVVYARSGKPLPNAHVQKLFGQLHGFDGELCVGDPSAPDVFRQTQSQVMRRAGEPPVTFFLFDSWCRGNLPYGHFQAAYIIERHMDSLPPNVALVEQTTLHNAAELEDYEEQCLAHGFEGVMLRDPDAGYKQGRSTAREGILLKLKRFVDAEAEVLGMEEQLSASGQPNGVLGALKARDVRSGVVFNIASGFTQAERERLWRDGPDPDCLARYRHFPSGGKDKPRFPVFAGLRARVDAEVAYA